MSRLNNILKFIVFQLNTILGLLGIVLFIFSAYSLFADWGDLDASFFIGISLGGVCAGISLLLISSLGSMGIEFQTKKSLPWTGKRILSLYFIFIAMGLGACCWYLYTSTDEVSSLKSARASLDTDDVKPYDYFETVLSEKFNQFYFGVESQCGGIVK